LPAWKAFKQSIGTDGSVGIWHETFAVAAGAGSGVAESKKARPAMPGLAFEFCGRGERIRTSGLYVPNNECTFRIAVALRLSAAFSR
jgi:hypothetical protein